jgi:hypothetical protein
VVREATVVPAPVTVEDVPSRPYRALELLLLVGPSLVVVLALAVVVALALGLGPSLLTTGVVDAAAASLPGVLLLLAVLALVTLRVVGPVLLVLDARRVRAVGDVVDWEPSSGRYAVATALFGVVAATYYLYRRQEWIVDWEGGRSWWLLALGVGLVTTATQAGAIALGSTPAAPALGAVVGVLGYLCGVAVLPALVYRDASYVRLHATDWRPNPIAHYAAAAVAALCSVPGLLAFLGIYCYRRHHELGTP